MATRIKLIIGFTVLSVVAAVLLPAMPQPAAYHDFADHRAMFGVANFLDVASNLGFLLATLPSRYTRGHDVYWVFAAYVVAKLLDTFDREFLTLGLSGHTLKHLLAAVAGIVVCRMLMLRTLREPAAQPDGVFVPC